MRWTKFPITVALAGTVFFSLPIGDAQSVVLSGGVFEGGCPGAGAGAIANRSCNLVFRNEPALVGLTIAQLNETVYQSCPGFPNGPYERIDAAGAGPIDYVTLRVNSPQAGGSLTAAQIDDQIGTDLVSDAAGGVQVTISGTFNNNNANVTIEDISGLSPSQILDLGGFDFVLFEKSQGGGGGVRGTLVCEKNMWGNGGDFGLFNFALTHGVNQITVGWVAGPGGYGSQANSVAVCDIVNGGGTERSVSYLVGTYKSTTGDPVDIVNVTGCGETAEETPVLTAYCDEAESAGTTGSPRPNSCNPEGELGGLPAVSASGVNGTASTCYFSARGTPMAFPC